jgi:hypothetical protein
MLAGSASSRAHDDDRVRLPPASSACSSKTGKKRINGPPPQPTLPAVHHAIIELFARLTPQRCPHCQNVFATSSGMSKFAKVVLDRFPPALPTAPVHATARSSCRGGDHSTSYIINVAGPKRVGGGSPIGLVTPLALAQPVINHANLA